MRQIPAAMRNVTNPDAARLAQVINSSGDPEKLLRDALNDAVINHDWARVAGIENSLTRLETRRRARELQALVGRGVLLSRLDRSAMAGRIPEGFEFGIAWLVCAVYFLPNGGFDTALKIGAACGDRLRGLRLPDGVIWPDYEALAVSHPGFGPASRARISEDSFVHQSERLRRTQQFAAEGERAMDEYAEGRRHEPLPMITWGWVVTGAHDTAPLFERPCPLDTMDLSAAAQVVAKALAAGAKQVGGDEGECYVHPKLLSAMDAYDFAMWTQREQGFEDSLHQCFPRQQPPHVVVSPLVAPDLPYMDQIMVTYWTGYGAARFSFRVPRSHKTLEEDCERTVGILRSKGVEDIVVAAPKTPRNSNHAGGFGVDRDGQWRDLEEHFLGRAERFLRHRTWPEFARNAPANAALLAPLPTPHLLLRLGVSATLSEHFKKDAAEAVKARWSKPCDPWGAAEAAIRELIPDDPGMLDEIARYEPAMLYPDRAEAIAIQWKLAEGACAVVTTALQAILDATDIGDDVPVTMLRPPFDLIYLRFSCPWSHFDTDDLTEKEAAEADPYELDGVMIQRFEDDEGVKLLLDWIIVGGVDGATDFWAHMPLGVGTLCLNMPEGACLGDLLARARVDAETFEGQGADWVLRLVAGTLLYMNSKDARLAERPAQTPPATAGGHGKAKKGHHEAKPATFGHIIVGPDEMPPGLSADGIGRRTVKVHYRRGYVRVRQRVGKGRKETRPVFIHPVLVNAKLLRPGESSPPKKDYVVGPEANEPKEPRS